MFDYKIIPFQNETIESSHKIKGFSERRKTVTRKSRRDRRRQKNDRRSSIRTGVVVNLSFKKNRRKGTDRRGKARFSRFV
ncbi:MAG: hypothetical protein GY699_04535 [Desulfobacteraceae bacterium]|nr:hypothetical protein [Desulfobacteraceae bacterium]